MIRIFAQSDRDLGITILLATHSEEVARTAHRIVHLRDGRLDAAA